MTTLACGDDALEIRTRVGGRRQRSTDVHLLAGALAAAGQAHRAPARAAPRFRTLFSPNPDDPRADRRARRRSPRCIGVVGDGEPGRGRWFFTPAPLCFAVAADRRRPSWRDGLARSLAPVDELALRRARLRGRRDRAFRLVLDYEGHTDVDGELRGARRSCSLRRRATRTTACARHRDEPRRRAAPRRRRRRVTPPAWWSEPIFCGWGAQCALAARTAAPRPSSRRRRNYDAFLGALEPARRRARARS